MDYDAENLPSVIFPYVNHKRKCLLFWKRLLYIVRIRYFTAALSEKREDTFFDFCFTANVLMFFPVL